MIRPLKDRDINSLPFPWGNSKQMPQATELTPTLNSLSLSETQGVPIRFLIHLPAKPASAARRNAIPLKVEVEFADGSICSPEELDRGRPYNLAPPHAIAGRLLESWNQNQKNPNFGAANLRS
jgi:hypothetical protein